VAAGTAPHGSSSRGLAGLSSSRSSTGAAVAGTGGVGAGAAAPCVFGLLSSSKQHDGATLGIQYRMFELGPARQSAVNASSSSSSSKRSSCPLQPLELQVLNLGPLFSSSSSSSTGSIGALGHGGAGFQAQALQLALAASPGTVTSSLVSPLRQAVRAAEQQYVALEGVCQALLRQLEVEAEQVSASWE
jgi:hypothetical protein